MRTSEAAKYARWAAMAAATLVAIVVAVYAWRWWQARQAAKHAPPPVPVTVQKRSEAFSFSKVEGDRTLFTVRASLATEFREGGKSLLEDVWITIYGRTGQRFDNIHTSQCDYLPAEGKVLCAGEVHIDLESAAEAKERPEERAIRIRTSNITFDRQSGQARTVQPLEFTFPYGHGRAVGVTYSTNSAVVRLERDVELTLTSSGAGKPAAEPLVLTGAAMEYRRESRTMRLLAPVRAQQGPRQLTAGVLALEFDAAMRAQRLVASASANGIGTGGSGSTRPHLRWLEGTGSDSTLESDDLVATFDPRGTVNRLTATGSVSGLARHGTRQDRLSAHRVEVELAANQPRSVVAREAVRIETQEGNRARVLETEALKLDLDGAGGRNARGGETLTPATVELRQGDEVTRLRAERLAAEFGPRSRLRRLLGSRGVEIVRRLGRGPEQNTTSEQFAVTFGRVGEWIEAEQTGQVRFREGERTAEAEHARIVHATGLLTLDGPATVADGFTRTTAAKIEIDQRTGEAVATGNVRTSYREIARGAASSAPTNFASQPAHVSANQLRAGRDSGKAIYSGDARMWQGDAVIEAESIELDRATKQLNAAGKVRGVFPATTASQPNAGAAQRSRKDDARTPSARRGAEEAGVVRFAAVKLRYWGAESKVRLCEAVTAESEAARITAREMTLEFAGVNQAQRVARVEAEGNCTVRQGSRRGAAERCEYTAAEGKFVLSGGQPTLTDPILGSTTGRQLTFFLADDKILVESEEGSRTVTRHRVEK